MSALRDCLFNIFAATLHTWRVVPPSATWGCAMLWWQGPSDGPQKTKWWFSLKTTVEILIECQ
jgi:hypothetical protein